MMARILLLLLFIASSLTACISAPPFTYPTQTTITLRPSLTTKPEVQLGPTNTSPILVPSITPMPTLTLPQAQEEITRFFFDNGGCQLPCVWTLQPGKTIESEIRFLQSGSQIEYYDDKVFIKFDKGDHLGGVSYVVEEDGFRIHSSLSYYFRDRNELSLVTLHANTYLVTDSNPELTVKDLFGYEGLMNLVTNYSVSQILDTHNAPTSILIAPYYDERTGVSVPTWIWYSIVLVYENQGFLVEYVMPRRIIGNNYAACPYQLYQLDIVGWDPEEELQLSEILAVKTGFYGIRETFIDYFKPLEEATTLTIETFTETFKDPDTDACIYTPMELWPGP